MVNDRACDISSRSSDLHVEHKTIARITETLIANGPDGMAGALSVLLHETMKLEGSRFRRAGPFEYSEDRGGRADGCDAPPSCGVSRQIRPFVDFGGYAAITAGLDDLPG